MNEEPLPASAAEAGAPEPPPLPPVAPPIAPGSISASRPRPVWPTVIGIVAIIVGAGGVLGGVWGVVSMRMVGWFKGFTPPGTPNVFAAVEKWEGWIAATYGAAVVLASVLLGAGIGVLKRRAWSRTATLWWAVLKMILSVATALVAGMMQYEQMTTMMSQMPAGSGRGAPPPGFFSAMGIVIAVIVVAFMIVWLWALPVFVLVWFNRRSIKEQVAEWQGAGRGHG